MPSPCLWGAAWIDIEFGPLKLLKVEAVHVIDVMIISAPEHIESRAIDHCGMAPSGLRHFSPGHNFDTGNHPSLVELAQIKEIEVIEVIILAVATPKG